MSSLFAFTMESLAAARRVLQANEEVDNRRHASVSRRLEALCTVESQLAAREKKCLLRERAFEMALSSGTPDSAQHLTEVLLQNMVDRCAAQLPVSESMLITRYLRVLDAYAAGLEAQEAAVSTARSDLILEKRRLETVVAAVQAKEADLLAARDAIVLRETEAEALHASMQQSVVVVQQQQRELSSWLSATAAKRYASVEVQTDEVSGSHPHAAMKVDLEGDQPSDLSPIGRDISLEAASEVRAPDCFDPEEEDVVTKRERGIAMREEALARREEEVAQVVTYVEQQRKAVDEQMAFLRVRVEAFEELERKLAEVEGRQGGQAAESSGAANVAGGDVCTVKMHPLLNVSSDSTFAMLL